MTSTMLEHTCETVSLSSSSFMILIYCSMMISVAAKQKFEVSQPNSLQILKEITRKATIHDDDNESRRCELIIIRSLVYAAEIEGNLGSPKTCFASGEICKNSPKSQKHQKTLVTL